MPSKIVTHAGEQHEKFSESASGATRTLALSAIAVVWLFAHGLASHNATPQTVLSGLRKSHSLRATLTLAVLALALDLLQFAWGAFAWQIFHSRIDIVDIDTQFDHLTPSRSKAWSKASRIGIVRTLETESGLTHDGDLDARRDAVRRQLLPQQGAKRPDSLQEFLDRPAAPRMITRGTNLLFTLKIGAVIACYTCLGTFLL